MFTQKYMENFVSISFDAEEFSDVLSNHNVGKAVHLINSVSEHLNSYIHTYLFVRTCVRTCTIRMYIICSGDGMETQKMMAKLLELSDSVLRLSGNDDLLREGSLIFSVSHE